MMMDRSLHVARALHAIANQQPSVQLSADPMRIAAAQQQVSPRGGTIAGNLMQAGRNVMGAPQRVATNIGQLPGLFGLGQKAMR